MVWCTVCGKEELPSNTERWLRPGNEDHKTVPGPLPMCVGSHSGPTRYCGTGALYAHHQVICSGLVHCELGDSQNCGGLGSCLLATKTGRQKLWMWIYTSVAEGARCCVVGDRTVKWTLLGPYIHTAPGLEPDCYIRAYTVSFPREKGEWRNYGKGDGWVTDVCAGTWPVRREGNTPPVLMWEVCIQLLCSVLYFWYKIPVGD